jgi:alpha-methylacyl-CoA racemase
MGGGGLFLAFGVLAALHARQTTGIGQVVDASVVDGVALMGMLDHYFRGAGLNKGPHGTNELDGGSHYYAYYQTADRRWIAFGAVEPRFRAEMHRLLGLEDVELDEPGPAARERVAAIVAQRTRAEWQALFEGTDACFAPVLRYDELHLHEHNAARESFIEINGSVQPVPGPRFAGTPARRPRATRLIGADTNSILGEIGLSDDAVARLAHEGVIRQGDRGNS